MINNFNITDYSDRLDEIEIKLKELAKEKKNLLAEISQQYKEDIDEAYSLKDEPFGKITLPAGAYAIEVTTPKKVKWDQEQLGSLYKKIAAHENPEMYIQVEYKVSETAYKKWPINVVKAFEPARTVEDGTKTIKIVPAK